MIKAYFNVILTVFRQGVSFYVCTGSRRYKDTRTDISPFSGCFAIKTISPGFVSRNERLYHECDLCSVYILDFTRMSSTRVLTNEGPRVLAQMLHEKKIIHRFAVTLPEHIKSSEKRFTEYLSIVSSSN
jgi:hypothetical protein